MHTLEHCDALTLRGEDLLPLGPLSTSKES